MRGGVEELCPETQHDVLLLLLLLVAAAVAVGGVVGVVAVGGVAGGVVGPHAVAHGPFTARPDPRGSGPRDAGGRGSGTPKRVLKGTF